MEEDLEQERLMNEAMEVQRRILSTVPSNHNFDTLNKSD